MFHRAFQGGVSTAGTKSSKNRTVEEVPPPPLPVLVGDTSAWYMLEPFGLAPSAANVIEAGIVVAVAVWTASMTLPGAHGVTQTRLPGEVHCSLGGVVPTHSTAIAYIVPATFANPVPSDSVYWVKVAPKLPTWMSPVVATCVRFPFAAML